MGRRAEGPGPQAFGHSTLTPPSCRRQLAGVWGPQAPRLGREAARGGLGAAGPRSGAAGARKRGGERPNGSQYYPPPYTLVGNFTNVAESHFGDCSRGWKADLNALKTTSQSTCSAAETQTARAAEADRVVRSHTR